MGYVFQPSEILDTIYNEILDKYELASNEYAAKAISEVRDFLDNKHPELDYTEEIFGDAAYGACAFAWVENSRPILLLFQYIND